MSRTIPQYFENGTVRVTHRDPLEIFEQAPAPPAEPVFTVPAGEFKEIKQIYTDLVATGVAARDFTVLIVKQIQGAAIVDAMVTGAVALTDGQSGSISMYSSGPTWLNDNGVTTNEDTNVMGIILGPGDTITAQWTNPVATDAARLQVFMVDHPNVAVL